jgi:cell division septal protein FtsQ
VIDERIAQRRARVRDDDRRRRLRRTVTVAALLLVLAVVVAVESSPLVGLEEVQVVGLDRLDAGAVRDAADLPLGTSTLRLRLRAAAARVEALPLVREAGARRIDPLTVRIEVAERQPALVVEGGGASRMVDRDGVIIAEGGLDGLPLISLPTEPPPVGETIAADATLANAHRAWRGLSGPLRTSVVRYEAAGPDELSLHLDRGIEVRFGRADRIDEKVRAIGAVLGDVGDTPIELIDVRAPSAPVVVGVP